MPPNNMIHQGLYFAPKLINYRLFRTFGWPEILPVSLTVSVTNLCNSRCRTCYLWQLHQDKPELKEKDFKTWEFEETFQNLNSKIFWVTMSGGEPFLRADLPQICESFNRYCSPKIINIPTNSLLPSTIESKTKEILEKCPGADLVINLSLDGVGEEHDRIRNVPGNFKLFLDTYERLSRLKSEFPNFQIGIHSVVSKFSIDGLMDVYELAEKMNADSYITEVAEHRTELFNVDKDITPTAAEYKQFIRKLSESIKAESKSSKSVSKTTQAFRLVYYELVARELAEHKQVIPCYAGYASAQINAFGDVWPCCVLGYSKPMGNLRENNYNFRKIWFSKQATDVRMHIKARNCSCPLANAHYTNILLSFRQLIKVTRNMVA